MLAPTFSGNAEFPWSDFSSWLSGGRNLSGDYAGQIVRALRQLEALGLVPGELLVGPDRAAAAADAVLAGQLTRNMRRRCQKALNLVARYLVARGRRDYRSLKWDLIPELQPAVNPYGAELVLDLLMAPARSFLEMRDLAAQHVLFWTRKRKGEVWRLRDEDLDVARRTWMLPEPEKSHRGQLLLLPRQLVDPAGPLLAYRAARRARIGASGGFWVTQAGRPMTKAGFSNLTWRQRKNGLDVNFHRWRHTGLTFLDDHGVPLQDIQAEANHADPRTTLRYVHGNPHKRANRLASLVPGMEDHPLALDPREAWRPLLRSLEAQSRGGSFLQARQDHSSPVDPRHLVAPGHPRQPPHSYGDGSELGSPGA